MFDAFREKGIGIGAYFSKADWHCQDYWNPELRGQKKKAETAVLSHLCPLLRLETHGVEGFVQTEILFLESLSVVGPVDLGSRK